MKQCTSVLSSATSLLISPENAYINDLVLPLSEYIPPACDRAFGPTGRMRPLTRKQWHGGYSYRPFKVMSTGREFSYSRRACVTANNPTKSSNLSVAWNPLMREAIINGVLQGRKQSDQRGASAVSRIKTCKLVLNTLRLLALPTLAHILSAKLYTDFKTSELLGERRRVKQDVCKEALGGWTANVRDDFELNPG